MTAEGYKPKAGGSLGVSKNMTRAKLVALFDRSLEDASVVLGVSTTMTKRLCRRFGISKWPYRKLASIDAQISSKNQQRDAAANCSNHSKVAMLDASLQVLRMERACILEGNCLSPPASSAPKTKSKKFFAAKKERSTVVRPSKVMSSYLPTSTSTSLSAKPESSDSAFLDDVTQEPSFKTTLVDDDDSDSDYVDESVDSPAPDFRFIPRSSGRRMVSNPSNSLSLAHHSNYLNSNNNHNDTVSQGLYLTLKRPATLTLKINSGHSMATPTSNPNGVSLDCVGPSIAPLSRSDSFAPKGWNSFNCSFNGSFTGSFSGSFSGGLDVDMTGGTSSHNLNNLNISAGPMSANDPLTPWNEDGMTSPSFTVLMSVLKGSPRESHLPCIDSMDIVPAPSPAWHSKPGSFRWDKLIETPTASSMLAKIDSISSRQSVQHPLARKATEKTSSAFTFGAFEISQLVQSTC